MAGEGMARSFADMYGFQYVALRYFNVYGPRMDIHGKYTEVLIRWLDKIAAGEPPVIYGDGLQTMDLVYIDDVTDANITAMESEITDEVFNVASGTETSLLGLLHSGAQCHGISPEAGVFPRTCGQSGSASAGRHEESGRPARLQSKGRA